MFLANMEITVLPDSILYMSLETSHLYKTLQEEENSYVGADFDSFLHLQTHDMKDLPMFYLLRCPLHQKVKM